MDYIAHHGILGMKWGVRRFQNPDGTLTEAGKKRYNKAVSRSDSVSLEKRSGYEYEIGYNEAQQVGRQLIDQFIEQHGAKNVAAYANSSAFKNEVEDAMKRLSEKNLSEMSEETRKIKSLMEDTDALADDYDSLIDKYGLKNSYGGKNTIGYKLRISETDGPLKEYEEAHAQVDEAYKTMKKWIENIDAHAPSKELQKQHSKELDEALDNRRKVQLKMEDDGDEFSGKDINFLLKQKAIKNFFADPDVKEILNTRNRILNAADKEGVNYWNLEYSVPQETERALRYKARKYFGGREDDVIQILEELDTNQDYNTSLNPYYNGRAWLYWH